MEPVGYLLGLIGLALAVYPESRFFHWVGVSLLVLATLVILKAYANRGFVQLIIFRRALLFKILESYQSRHPVNALGLVNKLAKSGTIILYGELGSSKKLVPIPASHFDDYTIVDFPSFLQTWEIGKMPAEQDTEQIYFNIYAPVSLPETLEQASR
jgi:hypothetical protein